MIVSANISLIFTIIGAFLCVVTMLTIMVPRLQFEESEPNIMISLVATGSDIQEQIIVSLSTRDVSTQGL